MHKLTAFSALVVLALVTASCSDTDTPLASTEPTTVTVMQSGLSVSPSVVVAQPVGNAFCPAVPPFTAVLNLNVRGDAITNLFVSAIRLDFVDTFGVRMPQVTLPGPVLTNEFGSMLIQARDARTFPLPFRFGCSTRPAGTLTVFVDLRDEHGRIRSHQITAVVR